MELFVKYQLIIVLLQIGLAAFYVNLSHKRNKQLIVFYSESISDSTYSVKCPVNIINIAILMLLIKFIAAIVGLSYAILSIWLITNKVVIFVNCIGFVLCVYLLLSTIVLYINIYKTDKNNRLSVVNKNLILALLVGKA